MEIDPASPEPKYRQLADIIRGRIETGRATGVYGEASYPPGSLVPSIEQIHGRTGLSVMTIRKGIGILASEGWVRLVPGKGTYVNPPELWPQDK